MRNPWFSLLHQKRLFWKVRHGFSRLEFFIYQMLFGAKQHIRERATTTKTLRFILKLTGSQLIRALLSAAVLQFSNPFIGSHLVSWCTKRGFTPQIQVGDYVTLLATVIGVGGVFIGLYYAAICAIGGAIYARVPNNIRGLLANEQVGNTYMRFVAWFTYLGVCLLAFHTVGFEPILLVMPLFVIGAGVAIIGFVRLGARAFNLFDPTVLSGRLFEQLRRCYLRAQAGEYRWANPAFQNHAHRAAQATIDTFTTVADITAKEPHLNGRPLAELCKNLLVFLLDYERRKKLIPTDSLWYRQRYEHPDWYRTGETETSRAHNTATRLQPETVNDPRWLESAILPIVKRCLAINIQNKRYDIVNELLGHLDGYTKWLANEHQVEFAFNLIREVFSQCENLLFVREDGVGVEEPLEHMGICEQLAVMPINILVAYTRAIESYGKEEILQRLRSIKWKSEKSIYFAGFKVHVLKQLEELRPKLEAEEEIEGRVISSPWYLRELIAKVESENLSAAMVCFHDEVCKLYESWIESAKSSNHSWLAAVMMSRELEYWNKLDYHTNTLNQLWADLTSERRIQGIRWPSLDTDELSRKKKGRRTELLKLMSEEIFLLSFIPRPASYPDFAGQFLHTVGEALLTSMCEKDCDTVEALFKRYFHGSRLQFDRLRPRDGRTDWQSLRELKVAAAPLLDLIDLSGYVYLLSDYHDTPEMREPIVGTWDEYLAHAEDSPLQSFAAAVALTESGVEMAHRSVNRTRWRQTVVKRLEHVERQEFENPHGAHARFPLDPVILVIHESPLVRIFARDSYSTRYDGIDIFIAKYIRSREDGQNLDFGARRHRDFREEIRRAEDRYTYWTNNHDTSIQ